MFGSKRISELEERVAKLRRDLDDRDLDWVDMRARCKRLLDRTEKAQRAIESNDGGDAQETPTYPENGSKAVPGRLLTPHQLEMQRHILKRRVGIFWAT